MVMGKKQFERLPVELQEIVLEAAAIMQEHEHNLHLEQENLDREFLISKGMEFVEVDKEAFEKIASKAVLENFSEGQKEMFRKIQAIK